MQLKIALEEATTELPKTSKKNRKVAFSEETEKLLAERQGMIDQRNIQGYEELTKAFRKSKQVDKNNIVMESIDKVLDMRDKWLGIR